MYYKYNRFLVDINQELPQWANQTYRENLLKLERFAMYRFSDDQILIPAETAWFGWKNHTSPSIRDIYSRIGLDRLLSSGMVHFHTAPGKHMQIVEATIVQIAKDLTS